MDIIFAMEIAGTAAFALSGAILAAQRKLDVFGILVVSVTCAVGGGLIRDVILGNTPPAMFTNSLFCIVSASMALAVIVLYRVLSENMHILESMHFTDAMTVLDAIGLATFTIVGVDVSINCGFVENPFLSIFVGVMTGVGGGILRDILINRTPVILLREIYAIASIAGAVLYFFLLKFLPNSAAYISTAIIILIRLFSVYKKVHLPNLKMRKADSADGAQQNISTNC